MLQPCDPLGVFYCYLLYCIKMHDFVFASSKKISIRIFNSITYINMKLSSGIENELTANNPKEVFRR